jgi:orotate phosphoribosyltransferase
MTPDIFSRLPSRTGHFLLESGYHTDIWLTLDSLFSDPQAIAPLVTALAERLRPHGVSAVCGCLLGGAFLAQALSTALGVRFYYTEPRTSPADAGPFKAQYALPTDLRRRVRGERVAAVDDVISAGSSVRATVAALTDAGASTAVVGALFVLGRIGLDHFASLAMPVESLGRRDFNFWEPSECPLCAAGAPVEDPVYATS